MPGIGEGLWILSDFREMIIRGPLIKYKGKKTTRQSHCLWFKKKQGWQHLLSETQVEHLWYERYYSKIWTKKLCEYVIVE